MTESEPLAARRRVRLHVNDRPVEVVVEPRRLLSDVLRDDLGLTGTHVGCEHGVCGTCTVLLDDRPVRSCLTLAVQVEGRRIRTIEGVGGSDGELHPVQAAFREHHGLQCGFCTPGFVMTLVALAERQSEVDDDELADHLAGHLCRCTGYRNIFEAARVSVGDRRAST